MNPLAEELNQIINQRERKCFQHAVGSREEPVLSEGNPLAEC